MAARGESLWRQGEMGRGRHRDRRAADVAVGEPDHQVDPVGRNHFCLFDFGHRHGSEGRDEIAARGRRSGRRRSFGRRALPPHRHRRDRCGRGRGQRPWLGRTARRCARLPRPRCHRLVQFDRAEPVCHRSRAAGDRRAPVRAAGRSGRKRRVSGVPRRVGDGDATRTARPLDAVRGFLHGPGCSTTC